MTPDSLSRLGGRFGKHTRVVNGMDVMSEEEFYALRARIERMNDVEFSAFRDDPVNRIRLRQYDSFAVRQVLPYAAMLILLFLVSLALAGALRF